MSFIQFEPTGDRVLVDVAEVENKTAGGIIIPDTKGKEKPNKGTIVALGSGENMGKVFTNKQIISFTKSYEIKIEDKSYAVVNCEDILGIYK